MVTLVLLAWSAWFSHDRLVGTLQPGAPELRADARALGRFLSRIAGTTHPGPKILLDHPETRDRVAAIEAVAGSAPSRPLLDQAEWAALKNICVMALLAPVNNTV